MTRRWFGRGLVAVCGLLAVLALPAASALAQTGNPTHDALSARSDAERRQALLQGLRAGGIPCSNVVLAFHAGLDSERNAYWDIRCADGPTYRATIVAERFAGAVYLACGAAGQGMRAGPCFQALGAAGQARAGAGGSEANCRAACQGQPQAAQGQCVQRCTGGTGIQVGQQAAEALPPNSRFGAMYFTDNPTAAFGFANGVQDRLEVNMRAVRACQQMAGRVPCKFHGEIVNRCGAIAFAISRHPSALVMTSDISTQVLNHSATGQGATQQAAEAEAMEQCRRAEGPGVQCRIVASGC
ncbi:MAG: hypothetical protein ACK44F_06335 [Roseococcus sp.]